MSKRRTIFGFISEGMNPMEARVRALDTTDMTLQELEGYRNELQRLEKLGRQRRARNVRLVIYAVVLFALIIGLFMLPGTIRAQNGPVVLTPMGESSGVQQEGPDIYIENYVKKHSAHSFQLFITEAVEDDPFYDFYIDDCIERTITGVICREPEKLNRKGKSSVIYSDGTTGAVWYERRPQYGEVYLMVEYKMNLFGYTWGPLDKYNAYREREKHD